MPRIKKVAGIEFDRRKREIKEKIIAIVLIAIFMVGLPLIVGLVEAL